MGWRDGRGWAGWLRRNDPLGAIVKGCIAAGFGVVFLVKGLPWLGLIFIVLGVAVLAMPIWLSRRDEQRFRRWQSRRTQ